MARAYTCKSGPQTSGLLYYAAYGLSSVLGIREIEETGAGWLPLVSETAEQTKCGLKKIN